MLANMNTTGAFWTKCSQAIVLHPRRRLMAPRRAVADTEVANGKAVEEGIGDIGVELVDWSPRSLYPDAAPVVMRRKKSGTSLVNDLWNLEESTSLVQAAKDSAFIQGIKNGTLDPQKFGVYNLQDAVYLSKALDNFTVIQHNPGNTPELKGYYKAKVDSYTGYRDGMFRSWHINEAGAGGIRLSPAARDYISFETAIVGYYPSMPIYYALANYPCFQLWPTMSEYLKATAPLGSVYQGWIKNNASFSSAIKLGNLIENHRVDLEWEAAKGVFLTALQYEVDFFNSVGQDW